MSKLREIIRKVINEETGKVTAKPIVKKGEQVKVFNIYKNRKELIQAATNSESNEPGEYFFTSRNGTIVTWGNRRLGHRSSISRIKYLPK